MRLRLFAVTPLLALMGAGVAIAPSIGSSAASSTATVTGLESLMFSPANVTIAAGGQVTFEDPSKTIPHGVTWVSGPETPSCSGVPIGEGRTHWSGTCTFAKAGTYQYYCPVHGMKMSGTITVEASGVQRTTTSTAPAPTTTAPSGAPEAPPAAMHMTMPSAGAPSSGPLPNSAQAKDSLGPEALLLGSRQRGRVRGSLEIAQSGSSLRVRLLTAGAQLGERRASRKRLLVGQLFKGGLAAGTIDFAVALDARARAVLARRGRLALLAQITLAAPDGASLRRTLAVDVSAPAARTPA
jgi:plastocyanin